MNRKLKDKDKYNLTYPSYITAKKRIWISEEGDIFVRDGQLYQIIQVLRPRIRGAKPQIVLKPIEEIPQNAKEITANGNRSNGEDRGGYSEDYIPF